jgi:hypothetical protein
LILPFLTMNTTRITCALVTATFGALGLGALNGQPAFGVVTAILGGAAMIASLMVRQQVQRKKLISQIAIMLR